MKHLKIFEVFGAAEGDYVVLGDYDRNKLDIFWYHLYGIIVQNCTDYYSDARGVFLVRILSELNDAELKKLENNNRDEPELAELDPLMMFVHEANILHKTNDLGEFIEKVEDIEFNENGNYFTRKKFVKKIEKVKKEIKFNIKNFYLKKDANKYNL